MNRELSGVAWLFLLANAPALFAADQAGLPVDCTQRLEQFVPAEVETETLAMRAKVQMTSQAFRPTAEMREKQLAAQYQESAKYQEDFPSLEAFITFMRPLIAQEEVEEQAAPAAQFTCEVIVSATGAYARYFSPADVNAPTQEVIQVKVGVHEWRTIRFDHTRKIMGERIQKNRNEYFSYFAALTPQKGHRTSWRLWQLLLNMEHHDNPLANVLCETGRAQISDLLLEIEFTDDRHCVFRTQTPVPNGRMTTEYELARGPYIRLIRYALHGPELTTQVSYEYGKPESPWPTQQHLIDRNILADQTLRDRTLQIEEVSPAAKWDFNAILNDLKQQHIDYSCVQE